MSEYFSGFTKKDLKIGDMTIHTLCGGSGEKVLLLLHGHPESHLMWHKVAPELAKKYTVVLTDLRGYGDSDKPFGDESHRTYSKKEMAKDQAAVMEQLGFQRYSVVGHDRGARVTHRMMLEYPDRIEKCVIMDILPTYDMYAKTDKDFATAYWVWFFYIQPYDFPERLIGSDPSYVLRRLFRSSVRPEKYEKTFPEDIIQEYERHYMNPEHLHAVFEDYRAAATIDLEDDLPDRERKIEIPIHVLWGKTGVVGKLWDVLSVWKERGTQVTGFGIEDCGHFMPEEEPEQVYTAIAEFIG